MSSFARNAVVLGLLSAVGPFAIDMYLPALPSIAADLNASTAAAQLSLTVYFLAFGVFQILYGPISDMVGRKPPLYLGLSLFALGAIGGALAPSIGWLIAARVLQGVGAAAVTVIPRAIIRDLHTGAEATRLMAMVMLVFGVSPLLAPLFGSALIGLVGWRAVFVAMTIAALLGLLLVGLLLPETRPIAHRSKGGVGPVMGNFAVLLRDRQFVGLVLIGGFGMASFFSFLAGSSFIYIGHFDLTPTQYSLAFALNAIGFIGASQFAAPLGARLGMRRVVIIAVSLYAGFALLLLALTLSGVDQFAVLMAMLFVIFGCLGVALPQTMVLSLESHGPIAGAASALSATLQMLIGAALIALISLFENGTALPMVAGIAVAACTALGVTLATLRRREPLPQPAE
ncbi:multidrug effflux MFS transporter [Rhodopseudomonas palustris]|uniref:Bcr/CflA family efflux transporter n=1 Tax=Rhodopseudomonas palustris (strain BisB18) TaxID=316056 RepID=Q20X54_RHOPB